jgi:hypothetical protein
MGFHYCHAKIAVDIVLKYFVNRCLTSTNNLRMKRARILLQFDQPAAFRAALRDLLEQYANHAYRPGTAVAPRPLLPTYRIAPLIMRQLEMELAQTCLEQPEHALNAIQALWEDLYLEPRILAVQLLGRLPRSMDAGVLEKLRAWVTPAENFRMTDALFQYATVGLRQGSALPLLALIEEWINSSQPGLTALGLRAWIALINDPKFENIPAAFRMLGPLVQFPPAPLLADLHDVLSALTQRSQTETLYFLRQMLSMATGANTARLVRRCLPEFPPEQQAVLRSAMQTAQHQDD